MSGWPQLGLVESGQDVGPIGVRADGWVHDLAIGRTRAKATALNAPTRCSMARFGGAGLGVAGRVEIFHRDQ